MQLNFDPEPVMDALESFELGNDGFGTRPVATKHELISAMSQPYIQFAAFIRALAKREGDGRAYTYNDFFPYPVVHPVTSSHGVRLTRGGALFLLDLSTGKLVEEVGPFPYLAIGADPMRAELFEGAPRNMAPLSSADDNLRNA